MADEQATEDTATEPAETGAEELPADLEAEESDAASELVVVRDADEEEESGVRSQIQEPDKLLRLAGMVRGLLNEVQTVDLDEAGRDRLAETHNQVIAELRELVSDDLDEELMDLSVERIQETPTGGELRVVQAELGGWLEGLFHGIQASMASQQAEQRQQLMQQLRQAQGGGQGQQQATPGGTGQYL